MNIDDLTIGQARQLAALFPNTGQIAEVKPHPFLGRYCIIRTYSAGVHCGVLKSWNGQEVILAEARRIWHWTGAFTLSEIATNGPTTAKLSVPLAEMALTQAIEIIPANEKGETWLRGASSHKP